MFFFFVSLVQLTSSHPMNEIQSIDLQNEVTNLKSNINLLYEKLNEFSGGVKEYDNNVSTTHPRICLSKECIETSYGLFKNIDLNTDPCEDFYQFSCGNYMKEAIIPEDKKKLTSFSPLEDISKLFVTKSK